MKTQRHAINDRTEVNGLVNDSEITNEAGIHMRSMGVRIGPFLA